MDARDLPALNATLNATAAVLLVIGRALIAKRRIEAHKRVMIAAFLVSVLFLISYLIYHYNVGSVRFTKRGPIRTVYLTILATHTILAAAVPFLALGSLRLGLKGRYGAHAKLSRWTLPVWLYVSVTGVVVYWMLYRM
jgi:uncharacterized membrane protein YozB (DUF420 family)